jgi:hypothetical protein
MNRIKYIIVACALGLFLCATTKAREIQFKTLPEVVRTTVFHHYRIVSPEKVVRVVEEPDNIYEITVLTDGGDQIIYVTADGTIVQRPGTVVEGVQGSAEVTVTMDEIRGGGERYEFVQDQGPDAIFIDHQTNKRVIVKGGAGQGGRGGVRTGEGNQTDVQTNERTTEKNQTDIRTNEQNRSGTRTEERNDQSGNMREKAEQGNADQGERTMRQDQGNAEQGKKNMRQDERTQNGGTQGEQRTQQGNTGTPGNGNGVQERNGSQPSTNGEQGQGQKQQREANHTPGQQQTHERAQGKGKASPTP